MENIPLMFTTTWTGIEHDSLLLLWQGKIGQGASASTFESVQCRATRRRSIVNTSSHLWKCSTYLYVVACRFSLKSIKTKDQLPINPKVMSFPPPISCFCNFPVPTFRPSTRFSEVRADKLPLYHCIVHSEGGSYCAPRKAAEWRALIFRAKEA